MSERMTGAERIAAERKRQIEEGERRRQIREEGLIAAYDAMPHRQGQLVRAAVCYALTPGLREQPLIDSIPLWEWLWPWSHKWWKPAESYKDRIRDLEKAGALIAAEIDRLLEEEGNG